MKNLKKQNNFRERERERERKPDGVKTYSSVRIGGTSLAGAAVAAGVPAALGGVTPNGFCR